MVKNSKLNGSDFPDNPNNPDIPHFNPNIHFKNIKKEIYNVCMNNCLSDKKTCNLSCNNEVNKFFPDHTDPALPSSSCTWAKSFCNTTCNNFESSSESEPEFCISYPEYCNNEYICESVCEKVLDLCVSSHEEHHGSSHEEHHGSSHEEPPSFLGNKFCYYKGLCTTNYPSTFKCKKYDTYQECQKEHDYTWIWVTVLVLLILLLLGLVYLYAKGIIKI